MGLYGNLAYFSDLYFNMRNGSNELFFIIILIMKTQRANSHDVHWENKPRKFQLSKKDDLFATVTSHV